MMIPSGHNWIQEQRYNAPTLIILFITTDHSHQSFYALSELHHILILPEVLLHRVKYISELNLLPHNNIYIYINILISSIELYPNQ